VIQLLSIKVYLKKNILKFLILTGSALVIAALSNSVPVLSQKVFDEGILQGEINSIIFFSTLVIGVYLLRGILIYFNEFFLSVLSSKIISNIKNEVVKEIIQLPLGFFDNKNSSYILSRVNEVHSLSLIFTPTVFTFIANVFSMLGALTYIYIKSIELFIICIVSIPIFFLISNYSMKNLTRYSKDMLESNAKTNKQIHSALEGISTLKQMKEEKNINQKISKEVEILASKTIKQSKLMSKNTQILNVSILVIQTVIIGVIGLFIIKNKLSIGDYVALVQYVNMVFSPISMFQSIKLTIQPALAAISRIEDLIGKKTIHQDSSNKSNIRDIEEIDFRNVSFGYQSHNIIDNLSFSLIRGDRLALIGSNGSGKTTIAKLLLGLYQDYQGDILINGIDSKNINKDDLLTKISIVPQNIYLFEESILENIKIGNRDLSNEEFMSRINLFQSYGILKTIDLDKKVIENGKNLSKGQIQQIALMRVLVRETDILIFDEATSYLDKETRKSFKHILEELLSDKICVFISHDDELEMFTNKEIEL